MTGAGSGIGWGIAMLVAREGAAVVVAEIDAESGARCADEIRAGGGTSAFVQTDVADAASVDAMVATTLETFGRIDALVNNAGIDVEEETTAFSTDDWRRVLEINLGGVFLYSRACLPAMWKQGGVIVNIASVHALFGFSGAAAYDASKGGILAMTRSLAVENGPHGIRVNAIAPGYIDTPLWDRELAASTDPEKLERLTRENHPLRRRISPRPHASCCRMNRAGSRGRHSSSMAGWARSSSSGGFIDPPARSAGLTPCRLSEPAQWPREEKVVEATHLSRREFVRMGALGGAGSVVASRVTPETEAAPAPPAAKAAASPVIDAHFHIFPRFGTESGGEDPELNMRFLQYHSRGARRRRKSDRVWVDEPRFSDFAGDDMRDLPDQNFRVTRFGEAEVTIDGVDYLLPIAPPGLESMAAPPERMVQEMEWASVDMGVLQHDHIYGALNEYFHDAMRRFPGRFIALAQIREWEGDRKAQHDRLERAVREQGHKGLYFSVEPFALSNFEDHLDDARFEPLWDKVRELQIPVWWYLHSRRGRRKGRERFAGIMQHVAELDRWAQAHPDIPAVLTHGFDVFGYEIEGREKYQLPPVLMNLIKRPNMHFEVLFQTHYPEYPFSGAQEKIRELREELGGVDKMMWGSDMPSGRLDCTYQQAVDYIRLHCDFLAQEEKDLIPGGNAARMFGLKGNA